MIFATACRVRRTQKISAITKSMSHCRMARPRTSLWQPCLPGRRRRFPRLMRLAAGESCSCSILAARLLQRSFEVLSDCDVHLEISDVADKSAPRAIAEIPGDAEYCQTRQSFQAQLAAHKFIIGTNQDLGEIDPAIPIDVTGLAFEDEPHPTRGSSLVHTIWELHPAIVRLTQ